MSDKTMSAQELFIRECQKYRAADSGNQRQPSAGNAETGVGKYDGPKHTPGPWVPQFHFAKTYAGRSHAMVTANGHLVPVAAVILGVECCSEDEGRANARLIAAAPDLLAALKALVGQDNDGMKFSARIALATAAIAKAENANLISPQQEKRE